MIERGTVVAVRPGEVDIAMTPGAECGECTACSAAGGMKLLEHVPVGEDVAVGDILEIETPDAVRTRARALVFATPVLALVAGYALGSMLGGALDVPRDTLGAVVALTCGGVAFAAVGRFGSRYASEGRVSVRVHAIIAQAERPRDELGARIERPLSEEDQTRE